MRVWNWLLLSISLRLSNLMGSEKSRENTCSINAGKSKIGLED